MEKRLFNGYISLSSFFFLSFLLRYPLALCDCPTPRLSVLYKQKKGQVVPLVRCNSSLTTATMPSVMESYTQPTTQSGFAGKLTFGPCWIVIVSRGNANYRLTKHA